MVYRASVVGGRVMLSPDCLILEERDTRLIKGGNEHKLMIKKGGDDDNSYDNNNYHSFNDLNKNYNICDNRDDNDNHDSKDEIIVIAIMLMIIATITAHGSCEYSNNDYFSQKMVIMVIMMIEIISTMTTKDKDSTRINDNNSITGID